MKIRRYFAKKLMQIRLSVSRYWHILMDNLTRAYLVALYKLEIPAQNYRRAHKLGYIIPIEEFDEESRYNWHER